MKMRITVHELKKTHPCPRFIPTHVGNTSSPERGPRRPAVHPHACGEHGGNLVNGHASGRFIPTHVGNTYIYFQLASLRAVHPHACGEHVVVRVAVDVINGSSPRMWGTRTRRE